jgi:hypothetical protein
MQVAVSIKLYEYGHKQEKFRKRDEIIKKFILKINFYGTLCYYHDSDTG